MCDTLCAIGERCTLFAKNSDRPRDEVQLVEAHPRRSPGATLRTTHLSLDDCGAHALLGSRPAWMWGFEHGVNEHGVAIGNERIFTVDDPRRASPALTGMDLVRLGLERGANAEHALDVMTALLEEHGQGGRCAADEDDPYWSSFLVADSAAAWVLETSGRTWAARAVDDSAAISNRVTLRDDWTRASRDLAPGADFDAWRDARVPTVPSDDRLEATRGCLAAGATALTPADLAATMRHHGERGWGAPGTDPLDCTPPPDHVDPELHGFTVCFHVNEPGFVVETTTSSMITALPAEPESSLRAWVALGTPCASVYVPVFPPAAVPPELASPTTWTRFAALRDRVEDDPAELPTIRAVLGPLETQLWQRADADAHDPSAHGACVTEAWRAVDAALVRLRV